MKDDILRKIESILVTAGEECPTNYQTQFDWDPYMVAIDKVKDLVREAMGGAYPRDTLDSIGWDLIGDGVWQHYTEHSSVTVTIFSGRLLVDAEYDYEFSPTELRAFSALSEETEL